MKRQNRKKMRTWMYIIQKILDKKLEACQLSKKG